MTYKQLCLFVEGEDDSLFFNGIVKKKFENTQDYDDIKIIPWCNKEKAFMQKFISSIESMNCSEIQCDYIFVTDLDPLNNCCISSKKERIKSNFPEIDPDKIIIVVSEIEGWYLAGISDKARKKIGVNSARYLSTNPNSVTKEEFHETIRPKKFSRLEFLMEIIKIYDIRTGLTRNQSLDYFFGKYLTNFK